MVQIDWSSVPRLRESRRLGGGVPWFNGGWPVRSLAIDAHDRFVLAAGDRGMRLFHAATGELVRTFEPRPMRVSPEEIGFSAGGASAYARFGGFFETSPIGVWDVGTGALLHEFGYPGCGDAKDLSVEPIRAIDRQGTRAISADNMGVTLWDLETRKVLHRIERDRGGFASSVFLGPRADRALVTAASECALLWDLESGAVIWKKKIGCAYSIAAPADGAWFAAGEGNRGVRIHHGTSGELLFTLGDPAPGPYGKYGNDVTSLSVSANGARLAAVAGARLFVWDFESRGSVPRSPVLEADLPPFDDQPVAVIAAGGGWVVGAGRTGVMRRIELDGAPRSSPAAGVRAAHRAPIIGVAIGPDGTVFSMDGATTLAWDATGNPSPVAGEASPAEMRASREAVRLTGAPPPAWLSDLAGCIDAEVRRQDRSAGPPLVGPTIAANIMQDGEVLVWDLAISRSGPIHELHAGSAPHAAFPALANEIALHPDGRRIAIATNRDDAPVQLWDAREGRPLLICEGHQGAVRAVAFSPDGLRLVSGSEDRTVRVYDLPR